MFLGPYISTKNRTDLYVRLYTDSELVGAAIALTETPEDSGVYLSATVNAADAAVVFAQAGGAPDISADTPLAVLNLGANVTHVLHAPAVAESVSVSREGSGADYCTLEFLRPNSTPVPDADVWITATSDPVSDVVAGTKQTDSNGMVRFLLDDGNTYYMWMQKDGEQPIMGLSFVAVKDV